MIHQLQTNTKMTARTAHIEILPIATFLGKDNTRLSTMELLKKAKLSDTGYFLGRKATRTKDKNK